MPYEISTERLTLRVVQKTDAERIHQLRTNAEVSKFIRRDLNKTITEIETFIDERNESDLFFAITNSKTKQIAGTIAIWRIDHDKKYAELGYELFPEFQNKGMMTEAVEALLNFAFHTLNFQTIEAFTNRENINSKRLLEKCGFQKTDKIDHNNSDNVVYRISNFKL